MTRLAVITLLLLLFGAGVAHAQEVIPFRLTNNLPRVQASINGKKVTAVLDSGTGTMVISKRLASALGLHLRHARGQAAGGGNLPQTLFPVRLKTTRLGPIVLHDVSGYAMNLSHSSKGAGFRVNAFLGYPFFLNHAITINYPKRQIVVYAKHHAPKCKYPIPFTLKNNVPVVTARVKLPHTHETETVHLIVDLGSAYLAADFGTGFSSTKIGEWLRAHEVSKVAGIATGGKVHATIAYLPELDIGNRHFHHLTVGLTDQVKSFNQKDVVGSLGVPLWRSGSITLDYPDRQLCLKTLHK
jgi:hypothetical protein